MYTDTPTYTVHTDLNCLGPLACRLFFFSINVQHCNYIFSYDFNNVFFSTLL